MFKDVSGCVWSVCVNKYWEITGCNLLVGVNEADRSSVTDAKGLSAVQEVESLREKVYASLEEYCKTHYPEEPGRFAKLLLRLPALRSIGLKCMEHLFFFKLIGDTPIDSFLMEMLESPTPTST